MGGGGRVAQIMWYNINIGKALIMKSSARKEKVTFKATKKVSKPVRVSFATKSGSKVSFKATKKVSVPVKVSFYRKKKK